MNTIYVEMQFAPDSRVFQLKVTDEQVQSLSKAISDYNAPADVLRPHSLITLHSSGDLTSDEIGLDDLLDFIASDARQNAQDFPKKIG